jgi:hypothetical protein
MDLFGPAWTARDNIFTIGAASEVYLLFFPRTAHTEED